ncbi:type 1 glutamine amidotransferase domain-containing protein [Nitrosophilus kaiyonis]|uniref:type 1 glutamine amidotransferase domain-containing protein n=1 Tax=Nitrosophilus kaiyonis TaxID=2930200 RepID=UPI002491C68E|nr:type 1 glutamine amidotransferase domain-containing protein [Nitrosophilus kaiyonis]
MNVAILVEDLFDERELIYPFYRFKEEGYKVLTISTIKNEIVSKHGYKLKTDFKIDEIENKEFDIIFIPGGFSPDKLRSNNKILNFVKEHFYQNALICAICHGPWVLISAGILKGKKATGYFSIKDDIINSRAIYINTKVVKDNNIITATDPSALPEMMKKIFTHFQ